MNEPLPDVEDPKLLRVLEDRFGHAALRSGQARALAPILAGRDTVVVMPTGSGKSLCYQLPGVLRPGTTLVVSPLVALMKDQVDALRARGVAAAAWNSSQSAEETAAARRSFLDGTLDFLYVAPERLSNGRFLEAARARPPALVAVDEAHCVSQWGHDFRPDYLHVGRFLEAIGRPQTVALTATATPRVRRDLAAILGLRDPETVVTGFDRPNIAFDVLRCGGHDAKMSALLAAVKRVPPQEGAALVYVGSRKNAEKVAGGLAALGRRVGVYHAGLGDAERSRVQEAFTARELDVVVATNAFGMGIDRADVRLVVHYDLPGSVEAYYQEAGRGGRDGGPARALLLFSEGSVRLQEFFIDMAHPPAEFVLRVHDAALLAAGEGRALDREGLEAMGADGREGALLSAAANRLVGLGFLRRSGLEGALHPASGDRDELIARLEEPDLRLREDADRDKLRVAAEYARRRRCRRDAVLSYFEALDVEPGCGRCDVCAGGGEPSRSLETDETTVLRKTLAGVARTRGRAGKKKVALHLAGSRSKEVEGTWLERLPTFGLLEDLGVRGVESWLDAALDAGLLATDGGRYPVLLLTEDGIEVMQERRPPPEHPWPTTRAARRPAAGPPEVFLADGDLDLDLVERLRGWRREEARSRGVPPYVVFPDRTLADLARRRPGDEAALAEVHGFGPSRVRKFGDSVLAVLRGETPDGAEEA